jgi:hypothetical protein
MALYRLKKLNYSYALRGIDTQELGGGRCGSTVWSQRVHVAMNQSSNLSAAHSGNYCNQGKHGDLGDTCVKTAAVVSKMYPGIVGQNYGYPTVKYGTIYLPFDVSKTSSVNLPGTTIKEEIANAPCIWDDIINVRANCTSPLQPVADYIDANGNVYAGQPIGYVPEGQSGTQTIDRIMLFPECDAVRVKDFDIFTIQVSAIDLFGNNRAMHSFIYPSIHSPSPNDRFLWTSYQKDEYTVFHFFVYYLDPSPPGQEGGGSEMRIAFYSDSEYYYSSGVTVQIELDADKQALQFPDIVFTGIKYTVKATTVIEVVEGNIWVVNESAQKQAAVPAGMFPVVSDMTIVIEGVSNGKILVSDKWSSDHKHDNPKEVSVRLI